MPLAVTEEGHTVTTGRQGDRFSVRLPIAATDTHDYTFGGTYPGGKGPKGPRLVLITEALEQGRHSLRIAAERERRAVRNGKVEPTESDLP